MLLSLFLIILQQVSGGNYAASNLADDSPSSSSLHYPQFMLAAHMAREQQQSLELDQPGPGDTKPYYAGYEELYSDSVKRSPKFDVHRRGCIPRGKRCDTRPNDCCYNTSCRCNLWGNNCRCQRMGLFQKWG